jgi:hypothetical protein
MSAHAVPTLDEVELALQNEGAAQTQMLERLSKLAYQTLDEVYSRKLLQLAKAPSLSAKAQMRLIEATTPTEGLAADYRALFEQLSLPWLRATILGTLNRLENPAPHFDLLSRMTEGGGVTRSVLPPFRRLRGHWQALLSLSLPPFLEPMLAAEAFSALSANERSDAANAEAQLSPEEDAQLAAFLGAAALRRLPAVERAQSDEPFFWFNQACSDDAADLTAVLRPLGFLRLCDASRVALERAVKLKDPYAAIAAVVASLRRGLPVPDTAVLHLARFVGTRSELRAELKRAGRAMQMPASFDTPAAVMEGAIGAWMASPFEHTRVPRELETLAERDLVHEPSGAIHRIFVLEFEYEASLWKKYARPTYVIAGMVLATEHGCYEVWKPCSEATLEEALAAAEELLRENLAVDAAR